MRAKHQNIYLGRCDECGARAYWSQDEEQIIFADEIDDCRHEAVEILMWEVDALKKEQDQKSSS